MCPDDGDIHDTVYSGGKLDDECVCKEACVADGVMEVSDKLRTEPIVTQSTLH